MKCKNIRNRLGKKMQKQYLNACLSWNQAHIQYQAATAFWDVAFNVKEDNTQHV